MPTVQYMHNSDPVKKDNRVSPFAITSNLTKGIRTLCCIVLLLYTSSQGIDYLEATGNILEFALPVGALGITVASKDIDGFWQFCKAFAVTECVTYGLKYAVSETRPNGGTQSFPSGHTSATFCAASYIDMRYGGEYGIPAYALAALTGWSRIESNYHFPWDVAAGAVVGVAGNLLFTKKYNGKVRLIPFVDNGSYGAQLVCRW